MDKSVQQDQYKWEIQLDWLQKYDAGDKCCLIAENPEVVPVFKDRFPDTEFTCFGYDSKDCSKYEDLNVLFDCGQKFDSVFSQALLEHLCRPSIAIENMANLLWPGGILLLHTVEPGFQVHRYIDCVRFLDDYWEDLCRYLPIELVAYEKYKFHVFVAYRKLSTTE